MRKSLENTWRFLESEGEETPRRPDGQPFVHDAMPNHDEDELGFHYYKYRLEDANNGSLTLPRTFFGRSWFARAPWCGWHAYRGTPGAKRRQSRPTNNLPRSQPRANRVCLWVLWQATHSPNCAAAAKMRRHCATGCCNRGGCWFAGSFFFTGPKRSG